MDAVRVSDAVPEAVPDGVAALLEVAVLELLCEAVPVLLRVTLCV